MIIQPYLYQLDCLERLEKVRQEGRTKALIIMASGLGKTVTVAFDVKAWLETHSTDKILYVCHQNDILAQARSTFEVILGGSRNLYGNYHGGIKKSRRAQFLFASFQTMRNRLHRFQPDEFGYIMIDESHHTPAKTYKPIVEYFKPKFLLGATATPDRTDMKDIRTLFGGEEVYSLPLVEALARGLLTSVDYRLMTDDIIELGKIVNPYRMTVQDLNKKVFVPRRDKEIAKIILEKVADIKNPRVMIFCPSIRHAELMRSHLHGSVAIHSGSPPWKQKIRISDFRNGSVTTILTVDKFNEGVDIPEVNVIVFLRTTESQTIFYQQLGRGLRCVEGKDKVLVLDFAANCERIEMVHELVETTTREREKLGSYASKDNFTVDVGEFHFSEVVKSVLEILKKIRRGYTKDALIEQLQWETKLLGRTPSAANIQRSSREGRTADLKTFTTAFGTWNKALLIAGLKPQLTHYSPQLLIIQYKNEADRLGHAPTINDLRKAKKEGRTASPGTFLAVFTTMQELREKACVKKPPPIPPQSLNKYRQRDLTLQLVEFQKQYGRNPTTVDIRNASKRSKMASVATFSRTFGTIRKALRAAELI